MSTVQQVIQRGLAKSSAARPELMSSNELVDRVGQCLQEAFQALSEENPYIVGAIATLAFNGDGWARPADCLRAIALVATAETIADPLLTPGDEINVVPFNDQGVCLGLPSVTEFGQVYLPTGQTMDPSGGTLRLYYARMALVPTAPTDAVDPLFPFSFDSFLEFDVAAYAAAKDKRTEDKDEFESQKGARLGLMLEWASQQTYNLVQRFPAVTPPTNSAKSGRAQPLKGQGE